jgi:hypothetical protein
MIQHPKRDRSSSSSRSSAFHHKRMASASPSIVQLSNDEEDDDQEPSHSNGGRRSRQKRRQKRGHSNSHLHHQQQDRRLAYSAVYNLSSRLPSFGEHVINNSLNNEDLNQHEAPSNSPSPSQRSKRNNASDKEDVESRLAVSEPSFLREFDDMQVLQSKSVILIYVLSVIRDILKNPQNHDLADGLEKHCNIARPFNVAEEFAKIQFNIACKPYLLDPQKYVRLEGEMPVKSFLWILRDLSHHGRDYNFFAEDLVKILMNRNAMFYKLIPKILRWADEQLRPRFEAELGLHLELLAKHFRKIETPLDDQLQTQDSSYSMLLSIVVKCDRFPRGGQRLQQFKGNSFEDFKIFLSECTKIDVDKISYYRLKDSQIYDILDLTDVQSGMTCIVEEMTTTAAPVAAVDQNSDNNYQQQI